MISQPLVSILIPTYNRCALLSKAVKSALSQRYENLEVIVSDNASQDATPEIMQAISAQDQRVKYNRFPEAVEPAQNWRSCLETATGKYCFILCDDDFLLDIDYAKNGVSLLEKNSAGLLITDCILGTKADDYIHNLVTNLNLPEQIRGEEFFLKFWEGPYSPPVISCIFNREIALSCDAFKVDYTALMDIELWLKMMLLTNVVYNHFPSVYYFHHGQNWLFSMSLADRQIDARFIDRVYEFAQKRSQLNPELLLAWRSRLYRHYINHIVLDECFRLGLPEADFAAFGADVGRSIGLSYISCLLTYRSKQSKLWHFATTMLAKFWAIPFTATLYRSAKKLMKRSKS